MSDPIETPTPSAIRAALADSPKLRSRDLANQLNISEAQLLAEFDAALSSLSPSRYRDELEQMKGELVTLLSEEPGDA
mgnify:CR=1 FL=1